MAKYPRKALIGQAWILCLSLSQSRQPVELRALIGQARSTCPSGSQEESKGRDAEQTTSIEPPQTANQREP